MDTYVPTVLWELKDWGERKSFIYPKYNDDSLPFMVTREAVLEFYAPCTLP